MNQILLEQAVPGTRTHALVDVAAMPAGYRLQVPVHIVQGVDDGPTLVVIAANHGNEVHATAGVLQFLREINPRAVRGRVVAVPVGNPIAFEAQTRCTWIDGLYDGATGNLSWIFPGSHDGFITRRIAWEISRQVLDGADCVIDLHGSVTGSIELAYGYIEDGPDDLSRRSHRLARAFGMNILLRKSEQVLEVGSQLGLAPHMRAQGVPMVVVEVGHFYGLEADRAENREFYRGPLEMTTTGITNVMRALEMLDGKPVLPRRQVIVSPEQRCQSREGGLMVCEASARDMGRVFPKGAILARIYSLVTGEQIDSIQAPFDQSLLISAHQQQVARSLPMEQAFLVADWSGREWIENEPVA